MKVPSAGKADCRSARWIRFPTSMKDTTVLEEGLRSFDDLIAAEREMQRLEHEISRTLVRRPSGSLLRASTRVRAQRGL